MKEGAERALAGEASIRALLLPLGFALGLAGLAFLAPVRQNPKALAAFLGAAAVLCAWNAVLLGLVST